MTFRRAGGRRLQQNKPIVNSMHCLITNMTCCSKKCRLVGNSAKNVDVVCNKRKFIRCLIWPCFYTNQMDRSVARDLGEARRISHCHNRNAELMQLRPSFASHWRVPRLPSLNAIFVLAFIIHYLEHIENSFQTQIH